MKTVHQFFALLLAVVLLAGCTSAAPSKTQPAAKDAKPAADKTTESGWHDLFDGKTLTGWKETDFGGNGPVKVKDGQIILGTGVMTGVTWTNPVIKMNYEIELMAMRVDGSDFFCGLTFPVGEDPCSLIVGGWGGGVVGLSSLDGEDAANNETTKYINFENGKWYHIRLRVEPNRVQAWIDDDQVVKVDTTDRKIGIRLEVEASKPLGIATWSTTGSIKDIRIRKL
jgi:predicted small lipoprotein YifL